jgi:lipoprotein
VRKKIFLELYLAAGVIALASCSNTSSWWNDGEYEYTTEVNDSMFDGQYMSAADARFLAENPSEAARVYNKRVPPLNSLIVCRAKQCAPAELSMSREYIFNALAHIVDNNLDATALLCEANPQAHVCTNPYLTVPAKVGVTPAYVFFDGVKVVDASVVKGKTALNLALGYNLSYNGQTPTVCKPDTAMMYVKSNNDVVLNGNGFKCEMTSVGTTTIRVMFDIDYIDLDYGYIGGYYSIGLSGPANGGGSGYGLIRLPKDAHPLNPELMNQNEPENAAAPKQSVKPQVNAEALKVRAEEKTNAAAEGALDGGQGTDRETVASGMAKEQSGVEASAPREKVSAPREKLKLSDEAVADNERAAARPAEKTFENSSVRQNANAAQPIRITPDTIVKSDRVILKPEEPQELRPYEVNSEEYEPKFEEIYVDDLDEYIK